MKYQLYPADWKTIIRPSILARDQFVCQHCGIGHGWRVVKTASGGYSKVDDFIESVNGYEGQKIFRVWLHIAHLDHIKENIEPSNLLTLCPYHHAKYDKHQKSFMRKVYLKAAKESNADFKADKSAAFHEKVQAIKAIISSSEGLTPSAETCREIISLF